MTTQNNGVHDQTQPSAPNDYSEYSTSDLISRITDLESQLRAQNERLRELTKSTKLHVSSRPSRSSSPSRRAKQFDASRYSTRYIALKFAYLGGRYNGFEHANGSVPPKPTIEEVLWKALRKARLISPPAISDESDQTFDVVWDASKRLELYTTERTDMGEGKLRLELNWEGCQYSKCGRTDKGVSAFGQVVGIRVRSNRPLSQERENSTESDPRKKSHEIDRNGSYGREALQEEGNTFDSPFAIDVEEIDQDVYEPPFDSVNDELPYISILNSILPPDIRILAWCPNPPADFDARFSCRERRYKYFFTNPAFCPMPGPLGVRDTGDGEGKGREGWLDMHRMREAAKKLEGLHDFRNLCKIDASKQMPSCERRITFADVREISSVGAAFTTEPALSSDGSGTRLSVSNMLHKNGDSVYNEGPRMYAFSVNGSAFLWHQVRCMVAILFLVGQGLEEPSIVDQLLDIHKNPCRPTYEMADDAPLVLWDCIFPDGTSPEEDSLDWVYAGDSRTTKALKTKTDGKFGLGGVVEELWNQWRKAKMDETLAGGLLDLVLGQGDRTALQRGGFREPSLVASRSQKIFDGSETARFVGEYVPVMRKPKMESLEVQNAKYANGRLARREARKLEDSLTD